MSIDAPQLGIVIITMNRSTELLRTLRNLTSLPEHGRIVVVDNGSTDETAEVVTTQHPEVELIRLPSNIGAAGRNVGVRQLATPYVAFVDDDTWPAPGALSRAVALLEDHPEVAIVTGRIVIGDDGREDPTCQAMANSPIAQSPDFQGHPVVGFIAGASVVRTSAFLAAGGFEHGSGVGGEEELLAYDLLDAGWTLLYAPDVVVHHHPSHVRDHRTRQRAESRNRIRVALTRRSWRDAAAVAWRELRNCDSSRRRMATIADCARLLPALRWRRRLTPATEQLVRACVQR
jgi:GT2 family glycosyltransferase